MEHIDTILAGVAIFLAVSTPLSHGLKAAADRFHVYALTTPSDRDDKISERAVQITYWIGDALATISRVLPVVTRGKSVQRK